MFLRCRRYGQHFNPRSREGSDPVTRLYPQKIQKFQSTLPRRERLSQISSCMGFLAISIHAPAKGATEDRNITESHFSISIHAPAKGATLNRDLLLEKEKISIHAPAKGATGAGRRDACESDISIHAPAKGATEDTVGTAYRSGISIHAPAKGATTHASLLRVSINNFNPRSREGSDIVVYPRGCVRCNFNPRSREGSDSFWSWQRVNWVDFNPRSREGSDNSTRVLVW